MLCRSLGQRFQVATRNIDRLFAQPRVDFTGERHIATRLEPPDPGWITGDIGFRKDNKLGSGRGHVGHMLQHAGNGGGAVEQNRRRLDHGNFDRHASLPQSCNQETILA